jgi:cyclopropane-fatty-acyl-phospholipid synthase
MGIELGHKPFATSLRNLQKTGETPNRPPQPVQKFWTRPGMLLLQRLLEGVIRKGQLTVLGPDGRSYCAGSGAPQVVLRIADPVIVWRILLNPDLAIGEAYTDGALIVENGDIYDFLALCFSNLGRENGHWTRSVRDAVKQLGRRIAQYNPVGVAQAHVAHHYDLSDTLYELFLDADRQYSCAYYVSPDDTLERAQEQKKRHLAAKLLLQRGQRVLDIGSGWGGLAVYLADVAGAEVTGLTLSREQFGYSLRRSLERKMAGRVRFFLKDYRLETGKYDRIVSVGMFEHVGIGHYREYFQKISELLEDDGVALIHTIGRTDGPGSTNTWIHKYIFPGGYCPALSEILPAIEKAGLYVTDVEVLKLHYAETLKAWRRRFNANRGRIGALYDERFCRMWEFYLAGCEASFRYGGLVNFQMQLSKRVDAVPLIRDYIVDWERSHQIENRAVDALAWRHAG